MEETSLDIDGIPCIPNQDNLNNNLQQCDKFLCHELMVHVVQSYFELNPGKTPKDLEELMRELKLNSGLIATPISEVSDVKKMVDESTAVVIQQQYSHLYPPPVKKEDIREEHLAKYYLNISCRTRTAVIKEMSAFSTVDENLANLAETGTLTIRMNQLPDSPSCKEVKQTDLKLHLQKGIVRINIQTYSDRLTSAMKQFPSSKLVKLQETETETVLGLVYKGKIICPIGYVEKNTFGQTVLELVRLQQ